MTTRIILDCNSLCHRNWHALRQTMPRGVIFGLLRDLHFLSQTLESTNFVFCFDEQPYLRKTYYPQYKDKREPNPEIDAQMLALRSTVLPRIGYRNLFSVAGYEADDLIGFLCQDTKEEVVLVSGDMDLYQLLSPKVSIWKPMIKQQFTHAQFRLQYRLPPHDWIKVKALAGDTGDSIDGLEGVGIEFALRFLRGELPEHTKAWKAIKAAENQDRIAQYIELVTIPYPKLRKPSLPLCQDEVTKEKWLEVTRKLNFTELQERCPL